MVRVNGKIRAREVRVIGPEGQQVGIFPLADAINMARARGVDLVEIAATATPPVCRLVDFGKYRYEQAKKDKEARLHQKGNKVKEVQLSPQIDPHDFAVKLNHAIDFLCSEMKVKVTLRFRGREMAHKEFGFGQVEKFTKEVAPYGHPDAPAKLVGKGITVMFSPLPRNKRAKNPHQHGVPPSSEGGHGEAHDHDHGHAHGHGHGHGEGQAAAASPGAPPAGSPKKPDGNQFPGELKTSSGFANNPFDKLNLNSSSDPEPNPPAGA